MRTVRFTVSLPAAAAQRMESARKREGLTRSALVGRAIELYLDAEQHARLAERYLEGYRKSPETDAEVEAAEAAAREILASEPWS